MLRLCARTLSLISHHPFWLSFALALLPCGTAVAEDKPSDKNAVFAEAKAALAREDVDRTEMEGFTLRNTLFSDSPKEGGVLIGFDLGIGINDVIFALRPIYLTAKGETAGRDLGRFSTGGRQDKVKRVVQVKAKPGYAVAKVRFQSAISIQCIRLHYSRLNGMSLDPSDSYSTNWIGVFKRDRDEKMLDSLNSPIVGVFGNQDDKVVLALGLIHLKETPVEDRSRVREYAFPNKNESEAPKSGAEAGTGEESADVASEGSGGSGISWLPFVVFGVVAVPMFLVMMLVLGKKKQTAVADRPRRARPQKQLSTDDDSQIPLVHPVDGEEPKKVEETPKVGESQKTEEPQMFEEALKVEEPQKVDEAPKVQELQKAEEPQKVDETPMVQELQKTEEPPKVEEAQDVEELLKRAEEQRAKVEEAQQTEVTPKVEALQTTVSRRLNTADYRRATNGAAAAKKEEATLVGPADPNDPYWNSEELMQKAVGPREPSSGAALASVFIGAVALFFWCLPILGVPISITGLVFGIVGMNSSRPGKAALGVTLNGLGLLFAITNGVIGAYLAMKKHGH